MLQERKEEDSPWSLAWSLDDKHLAVGRLGGSVSVFDTSSNKEVRRFTAHAGIILGLAWNPHGDRLATGSSDGSIKVWQANTGMALLTLTDIGGPVTSVAWSPDGRRLAAAGANGYVEFYSMDVSDLMELAGRRLTRNLTAGECRQFLHVDSCPSLPVVLSNATSR